MQEYFRRNFFRVILVLLFILLPLPGNADPASEDREAEQQKVVFFFSDRPDSCVPARSAGVFIHKAAEKEADIAIRSLFREVEGSCTPDKLETMLEDLITKDFYVGISFLKEPMASKLSRAAHRAGFTLICAWSEEIDFSDSQGNPSQFLFGLDFHQSFRPSLVVLWGENRELPEWNLFVDRLDRRSSSFGRECCDRFTEKGMKCEIVNFFRNRKKAFVSPVRECLSTGPKNLVSWLPPSDTLRLHDAFLSLGSWGRQILYSGEREELFLKLENIIVLTQDPFPSEKALSELEDMLPQEFLGRASPSEHLKALAACEWLCKALEVSGNKKGDPLQVASALEQVKTIELPGYLVRFRGRDHRPAEKTISEIVSVDGKWSLEGSFFLIRTDKGKYSILR